MKEKIHRFRFALLVVLVMITGALTFYFVIFREPSVAIKDECFDWELPSEIHILRYNSCSSLNLIKETEGREIKANFVIAMPITDGRKDEFPGDPENVVVDGNNTTRYLSDYRALDNGLGDYHIDYTIYYDRIPLKSEQSDGRESLTAEFVLASKDNSHVSESEVSDFIELVDEVMGALKTK